MEKSSSNAIAEITTRDLELAAEAASKYFDHWAKNETRRLLKSELLIVPMTNGYRVGRHSVKNCLTHWQVENTFGDMLGEFTSKRSAITWSLSYQTSRFRQEQLIRGHDSRLLKLLQDRALHVASMAAARKKNNWFSYDLHQARLEEVAQQIAVTENDLTKILDQTKYYKGIWE